MARKKDKKDAANEWQAPRLANQQICFAGKEKRYETSRSKLEAFAKLEGATINKKLNKQTNMLVIMNGGATAGAKKEAEKLIAQGASLVVLAQDEFRDLFLPVESEIPDMLQAGPAGKQRLESLLEASGVGHFRNPHHFDLSGQSLKGCDFSDMKLHKFDLTGADLSGAILDTTETGELKQVNLQQATGMHFRPTNLIDCQCQKVQWPHMFLGFHSHGQKAMSGCDFTKANLDDAYFSFAKIKQCNFQGAVLTKTDFNWVQIEETDFSGADLSNASLKELKCKSDVSFAKAKLINANLQNADLRGVNFQNADLTGARLTNVQFAQADLTGTNFKNAVLINADFTGAKHDKAKNLVLPPQTKTQAGTSCNEIGAAGKKAESIEVTFDIKLPEGETTVHVHSTAGHPAQPCINYEYRLTDAKPWKDQILCKTMPESFAKAGELFGHGKLKIASVSCRAKKSPVKGKQLQTLAIAALSEVFSVEAISEEEVKAAKQKATAASKSLKDELLMELRGGKSGIAKFNQRNATELNRTKMNRFRREDFSGCSLDGLNMEHLDFQGANLQKASLRKTKLRRSDFRKANLAGAVLTGANLELANFSDVDFSDAKLNDASLYYLTLDRANLKDADLSGAKMDFAYIRGTNLRGVDMQAATWKRNVFDEHTIFPEGFQIPTHFEFAGKGHDPRKSTGAAIDLSEIKSFDDFMKHVEATVDQSRLQKAMKMLKSDRFQLFSNISEDAFAGVVKSQTDADLVYSCRLSSSGSFTCCTQNLNACGGLRGALCKHLLVLLIGLTQSGQLELTQAAQWCSASLINKPELDRDAMTEVLLKYKGAEAGEIDWRPVETLPEDYYAY
jgi:uncharacterized protein YjbI with pentapeptide repeats